MSVPIPADDAARVEALREYDVLDTIAEESFDRVTRLVARTLDVPIALVSLVDLDRQWFKSCVGLDARETSRNVAFCSYAIMSDELFVVPNALADDRFRDNPLVTDGPKIRAYAGAPLVTEQGFRLGTLCAIDQRPRQFSHSQLDTLRDLAGVVVDQLELRRLARDRKLFERITNLSPSAIYILDTLHQRVTWASRAANELLGYELGAVELIMSDMHEDDRALAISHAKNVARLPDGFYEEDTFRVRAADGDYRALLVREMPFDRDGEAITETLSIATDVTALVAAEARARDAEHLLADRVRVLEAVLESAGEGIIVSDEHRRIVVANSAARRLVGIEVSAKPREYGDNVAIERGMFEADGETVFDRDQIPLLRALRGELADDVRMVIKDELHPGGVHLQLTGRPILDDRDQIRGAVVTMADVTALHVAHARVAELAVTDALTGLPNRRVLDDRLELLAAEARRGRRFSLAIVDIDHFKRVNDTHGHAVGDRVLVGVAQALRDAVRRSDLVARLGGEEFCVVQTDVDPDLMAMLTERLRTTIETSIRPIAVTASFGVCHSSVSMVPGEMLVKADGALYMAKRAGRNRVAIAE
ncbi:MAG TPA: diguanylate cyclase [Kofleriaceae bacterium]